MHGTRWRFVEFFQRDLASWMALFEKLVRFAMSGNIVAIMDIRRLTAMEIVASRCLVELN
jgi:hypothetical protein